MKLIQNNPYRIIGVLSSVSEKEIQKQKSKITKYASIGKQIDSEFDFTFLEQITRNEETINRAFSAVEQNGEKVSSAIFWFSISNSFDGAAISYLSKGDKTKAIKIWDKVTRDKEVSDKNFSCFNNLGTLMLLGDSLNEIKVGIESKMKLIESKCFTNFVDSVADKQTFVFNTENQTHKFIDAILGELQKKNSVKEIIGSFSNCSENGRKYIAQKITKTPISKIESEIEIAKNKRKNTSKVSAEIGLQLFLNSKDDLMLLKSLLGKNDLNYKILVDNLAKEILQCGIDYFVDNGENEALVDQAIRIIEYAKSICVNQSTKDRIEENIKELNEIKYSEIHIIILVLKSIKEAINNLEIQNRGKTVYERQTINTQKVDEILMKEISSIRIQKLIDSKNKSYLDEFISLLTFVRDKLSTSGTKRILDLLVRNLPSNHEFVIIERVRKKKLEEEARKRKAEEEARKKRDAEREAERKRKEAEESQRQWMIFLGVIGVILLIAGAIWGWDGVIGVIVIGVLIMLGGGSR
jgi:hypothetical protein